MITITCNSIKDIIAQRQKYISFKSALVEVRRKIHHTQSDYLKRPRCNTIFRRDYLYMIYKIFEFS